MIPPLTIIMVNPIAIAVGVSRTIYNVIPQWSKLLGGMFFSFWVLAHLYPFAKGLMGRTPTIVYLWPGFIVSSLSHCCWWPSVLRTRRSADHARSIDSFTALACRLTLSIDDGCFVTSWIITYPLYPMRQQLWLWKEEIVQVLISSL